MNLIKNKIDFSKITCDQFEELCFELLLKHGFSKVIWRQGGADNGRDIEANFIINNSFVDKFEEKFFFECKKYSKGIPPEKLNSKIVWADAEKPQHLVFIFSSYITNNGRTWIEKIEKDKAYKIHIIEGKLLSEMISQHDDLISKYFIQDKFHNLLNETIEKWILHDLIPNFYTYYYLLDNLDLKLLSLKQKTFLYTLYYVNYSRLEEFENEIDHGINISLHLKLLCNELKINQNFQDSILESFKNVEILSDEGYLGIDFEESKNYDFIGSKIIINENKCGYYLFKRLGLNEAIEILLYQNSSLESEIRYIRDYKFIHYKKCLKNLNLHQNFMNKLIDASEKMK